MLIHNKFNVYFEDDSWTTSVVYNHFTNGSPTDDIFLDEADPGYNQFFGYTYNYAIGPFLEVFGWTKSNVYLFNSLLLGLLIFVWTRVVKEMDISENVMKVLPYYFLIFPPFVFAAHTGRPDLLCFLGISLGLLAYQHKSFFLAGLMVAMSVEIHLMGIIGAFYCMHHEYRRPALFASGQRLPNLGKLTAGLALGTGNYFLMHYQHFSFQEFFDLIKSKQNMVSPLNNYILSYFTDFDWAFHIPEFLMLGVLTFAFFHIPKANRNKYGLSLFLFLAVTTLLTRRENRNYFLFIAPALLLFYFEVASHFKKVNLLKAALVATSIMYCVPLAWHNKDFSYKDYTQLVENTIPEDSRKVVLGLPDMWFTSNDHEFVAINEYKDLNTINLDSFYLLSTDHYSERSWVYESTKSYILENYNCKCQNKSTSKKYPLEILRCIDDGRKMKSFEPPVYPGWKKVVMSSVRI